MSTVGKRRYPPNKRLAWQRLQKGWSREEMVRQISLSMKTHGETDTGLTADTARRWESGERWPEPRFRKHLVLVFGLPAADLGLLTPDELAMRPDEPDRPGSEMLDELRRLMMADKGAGFGRKQFLTALLAAGVSPVAASAIVGEADAVWHQTGKQRDPQAVAAYRRIAAIQREMYWASEPAVLLDAVLGHLRLGTQLLAASPESLNDGNELAAAVAETALLSARLAFFDLGHAPLAERCFSYAGSAVAQCGDHYLAAMIAAHHAFLPGFAGNAVAAKQLLDVATAHARYDSGPLLRAWLHCVSAEIDARTDSASSATERIRQAEDSLGTGGVDSERLDFFDETRLAGFAGNVALLAGQHDSAVRWLEKALVQIDQKADKQRSVLLFDLAAAHAVSNADHAGTIAQQACAELESNFYRTAYERIPAVQRALSGTRGGAELAQRANELALPATNS
ncbi:XRE family transcriptional regulator [Nocardia barduliensis]|uniref:XRE family transcriptional regulator n=1 Tax=Nocardia barduliensis TaxID=2736643 RepID=UPI001573AA5C|nr:XRE family transcriptional regulator [Nocardia barduliensis]